MRLLIADDEDYVREGLISSISGINTELTKLCRHGTDGRP